jgi:uncharacterized membrane protein
VLSRVRTRLSDVAASMDALSARLGHGVTLALWPALYAVTLGSGAYTLSHLATETPLSTNKLQEHDTVQMAIWVGVAFAALGLLYGVGALASVLLASRRGRPRPSGLAVVAEINSRLRLLLVAPLIPALTVTNVERDSPKDTLFHIALIGALAGFALYAWLPRTPAPAMPTPSAEGEGDAPAPHARRETLGQLAATVAIAALWAAYGFFFSRLSVTNHHALHTSVIDLGYYDNIFWQSAHGHPLACSFIKAGYHGSAHFDPLLVLLSPLHYLYPRAEMLLVLQSVWLGAGVVPIYLIAQRRLGSRLAAVTLAAMYVVYPALHGANMYEFHSLTLLTPVALTILYFLEAGDHRGYWLLLVPMLLVREDVSLLTCFIGAYAILSRRPQGARLGWITILICLVYFAIVKRFFMTSSDIFNSGKDSYSFAYYYEDLIPNHNGAKGFVISLLTNPIFVLKTALAEAKILYFLTLFLPLFFLPFFARPGRLMLAYGLFFCLLATRTAVFSVHFQYSSLLIPIAFALTPAALQQIEDGRLVRAAGLDGARYWRALLGAAFVASLLVSWKFGGILENATFRGGFAPVARTLSPKEKETIAWMQEQIGRIPESASVGTTNRVGAHVADRKDAVFYPEHVKVDYLFLDETELKSSDMEKLNRSVRDGTFELVSRHEKLSVYRRKK